jgi:hypothetical protein
MKRITLAALALLCVSGCAQAGTHNTVKAVTGYVPAQDDTAKCGQPPFPITVSPADSVWARCEWWQSGVMLKRDSLRTPRSVYLTFQPPVEVPNATQVETRWFARDGYGTSCMAMFPQMPVQTIIKPAAFTGLSVVP